MTTYTLTSGEDTFTGTSTADTFEGTAGGYDILKGGAGNDTFKVSHSRGTIDGGADVDTVFSEDLGTATFTNVEVLEVGTSIIAAADQLNAFDSITTASGINSQITFRLTDQGVIDFASLMGSHSIKVVSYSVSSGYNYTATRFNDELSGSEYNDIINGGEGNDHFYSLPGYNVLGVADTNGGSDLFNGGGGDDVFDIAYSSGRFNGGSGKDTFHISGGGGVDGGADIDTVFATDLGTATFANVEILEVSSGHVLASASQLQTFSRIIYRAEPNSRIAFDLTGAGGSIDFSSKVGDHSISVAHFGGSYQLTGTRFDDDLSGTSGSYVVNGGEGNDRLAARGFNSEPWGTLNGGSGDDLLVIGDDSNGHYNGGSGNDTIKISDSTGVVDGGADIDTVISHGLGTATFTNVEILDVEPNIDMYCSIEQLYLFDNIVSSTNPNGRVSFVFTGSGGTIDFSLLLDDNLSVKAGGSFTSDSTLIGTEFGDELVGSYFNDTLRGGEGNDRLTSGVFSHESVDTLDGGGGDDLFIINVINGYFNGGSGRDSFALSYSGGMIDGGADIDTVISSGLGFAKYKNVEILALTESSLGCSIEQLNSFKSIDTSAAKSAQISVSFHDAGGVVDFSRMLIGQKSISLFSSGMTSGYSVTGTNFADKLSGSDFSDTLNGGQGADALDGKGGNDIFYVDNAGDTVKEAVGGGNDRVYSSISYTLAAAAEVEFLATTYTAGVGAISLTGNGFAQAIYGNAGANVIDGKGGVDAMAGNGGNDSYYVDNAGDRVSEAVGGGSDRAYTSVSYTLTAGSEVEFLSTTNTAGSGPINLSGNAFAQSIDGNAGVNVINGMGGTDIMTGYGGNDIFYVDNAGDKVAEAVGGGNDRVYTSVSYTLTAAAQVESMATTNTAGVGAINLTGNAFAQSIYGNAGANVIDGRAGIDVMAGNGGNDVYYVDNAGDQIFEAAGGGSDRVYTAVSYTLTAAAQVEFMATTNTAGVGAINLTGNAFAQAIYGNSGANIINGKAGIDTMVGNGGSDIFVFDTALGATNIDRIADYSVAADTIRIDDAVFAGAGFIAGQFIAASAFAIGAAATTTAQHIIYNSATGDLIFDSNGSTAGGSQVFGHLTAGLTTISNADFFVI